MIRFGSAVMAVSSRGFASGACSESLLNIAGRSRQGRAGLWGGVRGHLDPDCLPGRVLVGDATGEVILQPNRLLTIAGGPDHDQVRENESGRRAGVEDDPPPDLAVL